MPRHGGRWTNPAVCTTLPGTSHCCIVLPDDVACAVRGPPSRHLRASAFSAAQPPDPPARCLPAHARAFLLLLTGTQLACNCTRPRPHPRHSTPPASRLTPTRTPLLPRRSPPGRHAQAPGQSMRPDAAARPEQNSAAWSKAAYADKAPSDVAHPQAHGTGPARSAMPRNPAALSRGAQEPPTTHQQFNIAERSTRTQGTRLRD